MRKDLTEKEIREIRNGTEATHAKIKGTNHILKIESAYMHPYKKKWQYFLTSDDPKCSYGGTFYCEDEIDLVYEEKV